MKENEPPCPEHEHTYDWEDDGNLYDLNYIGARCTFTYEIPPGPRGKKPRTRRCTAYKDMGEILDLLNRDGWISTKVRLPKEGERVLFFYDDRPLRTKYACPRVLIGMLIIGELRPEGWNGDHSPEITHWKPLSLSPEAS